MAIPRARMMRMDWIRGLRGKGDDYNACNGNTGCIRMHGSSSTWPYGPAEDAKENDENDEKMPQEHNG